MPMVDVMCNMGSLQSVQHVLLNVHLSATADVDQVCVCVGVFQDVALFSSF